MKQVIIATALQHNLGIGEDAVVAMYQQN